MADFERIEIDPATSEARFEKSDFAQVVFRDILETYNTDANIECAYTITSTLTPSSKDWIGLYRVGWKSSSDYVCFHWSPLPDDSTKGDSKENKVVFQAQSLPKEDGEFYQFCYVASGNQVRGASTPFQFKRPNSDDFVEVEDEESDMMVIKNKTIVLEDDLKAAVKVKDELQKRMSLLEQERDSLLDKLVDYNKMLHGERIEREQLQKQLKLGAEKLGCIETEVKDMALLNDGLREKITFLSQEKESILKRLDENERYITSLQEKIKALINEKDALTGRVKSLEQEKELFKNHFTSSEGTIQGYMKEIDRLKQNLRAQEEESAHHAAETCKYKAEVSDVSKKLERQYYVSKADREHLDCLTEKLRNTEDKLTAAEQCKTLLNDEVTAVQQAHQKMSQDLETSKMECDTWRQHLASMETKHADSEKLWNQEKGHLQRQIEQKENEISRELNQIREQLHTSEARHTADKDGSLYALQSAQTHLKERYARMKKENEELHKHLAEYRQKQNKWESCERDLNREIEDLKERLSMGADEYKLRYLECRKLQSEVKKLQKQCRRSQSVEKPTECASTETECVRSSSVASATEKTEQTSVASATETVVNTSVGMVTDKVANNSVAMETERVCNNSVGSCTERVRTAEVDTNTLDYEHVPACSQTEDMGVADLTNTELQAQLEDLGLELDKRYSKKQKYKQMYLDEKDKNMVLQKHYFEELLTKDAIIESKNREIKKLRRVLENVKIDYKKVSCRADDDTECRSIDTSELDPLLAEEDPPRTLEAPLTPLPAPMVPEVLPSAKVAAVKAVVTRSCLTVQAPVNGEQMHGEDLMTRSAVITAQPKASGAPRASGATPSAPEVDDTEDERFMDADGEPQVHDPEFHDAPDVDDIHPSGMPQRPPVVVEPTFHDAEGDPLKLCPVCNTTFPADLPQHMFEEHVDSHYGPICPICNRHFGSEFNQEEFESHVQEHFDQE